MDVSVMTYASEMFSWYAGSVDADTYFCPEVSPPPDGRYDPPP